MPPVFQPRTPTQEPINYEELILNLPPEVLNQIAQGDFSALAGIPGMEDAAGATTQAGGVNTDIFAKELAAQQEQQEMENVLAMLELLQNESAAQEPTFVRGQGPAVPQGESFYDKDDPIGSFRASAISNDMARANAKWAMENTPADQWMTPPSPGAREPLEAQVARARTLLDLLQGKGAGPSALESTAMPPNPASPQQVMQTGQVPPSPATPQVIPATDIQDRIRNILLGSRGPF